MGRLSRDTLLSQFTGQLSLDLEGLSRAAPVRTPGKGWHVPTAEEREGDPGGILLLLGEGERGAGEEGGVISSFSLPGPGRQTL